MEKGKKNMCYRVKKFYEKNTLLILLLGGSLIDALRFSHIYSNRVPDIILLMADSMILIF